MPTNEEIIRSVYACAEGDRKDFDTLVSHFAEDGYMLDIPSGMTFRGKAIGDALTGLAAAFPDIHRELSDIYVAGDVVVVELAIQGTHQGEMALPSGILAPTGRTIDVPCCDVFHLENGKVTSFHCYNAASITLQQLGVL